jgi:hypothetical protein
MPLSAIADIVALRGQAPSAALEAGNDQRRHNRGVRFGVKLMLLSLVLLPLFFASCFPADSPAPLLIPLTIMLAGLLWTVYSKVFGEEPIPPSSGRHQSIPSQPYHPVSLPSAPYSVEGIGAPRAITAEMADQPSVTDHTTQLLD